MATATDKKLLFRSDQSLVYDLNGNLWTSGTDWVRFIGIYTEWKHVDPDFTSVVSLITFIVTLCLCVGE